MEATQSPETVMKFYDELLAEDSANAVRGRAIFVGIS